MQHNRSAGRSIYRAEPAECGRVEFSLKIEGTGVEEPGKGRVTGAMPLAPVTSGSAGWYLKAGRHVNWFVTPLQLADWP